MNTIIKILIELAIPLLKNLIVYQMGKKTAKTEDKLKQAEKQKEKLKEINNVLEEQIKIDKELSSSSTDGIYDKWLSEKGSDDSKN